MNAAERDKLAKWIATLRYGPVATRETAAVAAKMLDDFPGVMPKYKVWAQVLVVDRFLPLLVPRFVARSLDGSAPQGGPVMLGDIDTDIISDLLDEWAAGVGKQLTALVDDDIPIADLLSSQAWRAAVERFRSDGLLTPDQASVLLPSRGATFS